MLLREASLVPQRLEACGPVAGMLPFDGYEVRSLILQPGDLLIVYTDGISEAMTADDEERGENRMVKAVPRRPRASVAEVLEEIFRAPDQFTAGAEQHDDRTLLVMKLVES